MNSGLGQRDVQALFIKGKSHAGSIKEKSYQGADALLLLEKGFVLLVICEHLLHFLYTLDQ